jgi:hypothetical protein
MLSLNFDYLMMNSGIENMVQILLLKILDKFKQRNDKHFTIFFSHRPFHCKANYEECVKLASDYESIENHLNDTKINLNLWGHVHHYERLPYIRNNKVVEETNMFSLIVGTGGNKEDIPGNQNNFYSRLFKIYFSKNSIFL